VESQPGMAAPRRPRRLRAVPADPRPRSAADTLNPVRSDRVKWSTRISGTEMMSAINFNLIVHRRLDEDGDRMVVTFRTCQHDMRD
jgi:hypothetical protein